VLTVLALGGPARTDEMEREVKNWTGTFRVVLFERDGVKTRDAELKKMKVIVKGTDGEFHASGGITRSRFAVAPRKTPKEIDCVYLNGPLRGRTILGIYKFEGGRLTVCYADPGKARPKAFATRPGSGLVLYVLQQGGGGK
jgi:uncharacterized protein (TIGR03067 family)